MRTFKGTLSLWRFHSQKVDSGVYSEFPVGPGELGSDLGLRSMKPSTGKGSSPDPVATMLHREEWVLLVHYCRPPSAAFYLR